MLVSQGGNGGELTSKVMSSFLVGAIPPSACHGTFCSGFISSSIHSHYTYLSYSFSLDHRILTNFLQLPLFSASADIFHLSSWIDRNWD